MFADRRDVHTTRPSRRIGGDVALAADSVHVDTFTRVTKFSTKAISSGWVLLATTQSDVKISCESIGQTLSATPPLFRSGVEVVSARPPR